MSKKILPVYCPSSVIWPKSWCLIAIISCHLPSLYCLPSSLVVVTSTADPLREWMREKNQWVSIHVTYTYIYICKKPISKFQHDPDASMHTFQTELKIKVDTSFWLFSDVLLCHLSAQIWKELLFGIKISYKYPWILSNYTHQKGNEFSFLIF